MEQNQNSFRPEAATDEPASPSNLQPASPRPEPVEGAQAEDEVDSRLASPADPRFSSAAEENGWWEGLTHGLRVAGRVPRPGGHVPPAVLHSDGSHLHRSGDDPGLTSENLADTYVPVATDAMGRAIRRDGLTPGCQRVFLSALAYCGVVSDACRAAGISRDTAYALRNSAHGAAFAIAWNAAILISRARMADELMSRGMNGCIDRLYRNGELVAERHRHDNRLAMAILTRLDRQAEGMGEGAATARMAAQEWDQFLDIVEAGGDGAEGFVYERTRPDLKEPPTIHGDIPEPGSEVARLARLDSYRDYGVGLPSEVELDDHDPDHMESWAADQWDRAEVSGFLDLLDESDWPETARKLTDAEADGTCPNRQDVGDDDMADTGLARVRAEYACRFPTEPPVEESGDGFEIWEDEELGFWVTDYPPPEGFDGHEEGEWGDVDYKRALCLEEQEAVDHDVALGRAEEEAERARALAEARAARDRAFGFAEAMEQDAADPLPLDGGDEQVAMPPGHGFGSRGDPNLLMGGGGVNEGWCVSGESTPPPTPPHRGEGG